MLRFEESASESGYHAECLARQVVYENISDSYVIRLGFWL
jgi:hypothetical protein